jgi:hypothetical protein
VVNVRRPHGTATQEMRRYASFIGTSNHKDLLTDTSGSRRYIVINVTAPIDCSPIDYEQLLAIEILEQVQHDSRIHVSNCNIIQFGRILQRNQVPSVHTKRGNVYKVVRIKPKRE